MLCKILAFFILPCLVISFKMDMKPAFEGESADLINAIQAYDKIAVEINGHPIQANRLDNATSESPGRNQCQDSAQYASNCPGWKWACTDPRYVSFMQNNCKKSCGLCSDPGQCQDSNQYASNCPWWKWACTDPRYISFMQNNCQKSCGWCSTGSGQTCSKIPTWIKNAINGNGKIVGGLIAPSPIPWQVQVRVSFNSLGTNSFCGGTILDEETILSAAHCFIDQNTGEGIFPLGDTDIIVAGSKNSGTAGPQTIRIKNVINHPNYNRQTLDFDFSIVKLTSPLSFNTNVKPACLPTASFVPGGVAVASGWGSIKTVGGTLSNSLRYVALPLHSQCTSSSNHICAGYLEGGKGVCSGDSGGPLVVPRSNSDDTAVVIGISSWVTYDEVTKDCKMSVFAKVSAELEWIKTKSGVA